MTTIPRPVKIIIENYNNDIREARKDNISIDELIALMGSISETTLVAIPKPARQVAWKIVTNIMEDRFNKGSL